MGPRPERRGSPQGGVPAPVAVEHRASMGPRPERRGSRDHRRGLRSPPPASMGPRPERRGSSVMAPSRRRSSSPSFNGASPREARKLEDLGSAGPDPSRASMGPRPERRGSLVGDHHAPLHQRVASMGPRPERRGSPREAAEDPGPQRASMGPRPERRGSLVKRQVRGPARLAVGPASMGPRPERRGSLGPIGSWTTRAE